MFLHVYGLANQVASRMAKIVARGDADYIGVIASPVNVDVVTCVWAGKPSGKLNGKL